MAIKLRNNQVAKLTATDYDNALSQLVYSGSVSGSSSGQALLLHFTGSSAIDYSPRSVSIPLPDTNYIISTHDQGSNAIIRLNPSVGSATEVKLVAGTGISVTPDNATGNITLDVNFPSDNNTTYTVAATTATGGANLALSGSNSVFDAVKFASGTNVSVSRTDASTITISSTDTNTTYGISAQTGSGGANLRLTDSGAGTDDVKFASGTNVTVAYTDANTITISSTDTNTDVDVSVANLQSRLGEISSNTTIGDATDVTVTFAGDVQVNGSLTATEVFTNIISSSVSFASGSTIFGDAVVDTHQFTGSVDISGSLKLRGKLLDNDGDAGSNGQMLVSTGTGINWVDATSGYSGWTVSDGTNSENIASTDTVTFSGDGATTVTYSTSSNVLTISSTDTKVTVNNNTDNYVLTGTGTADTINGEATLTYNGSKFKISPSGNGYTEIGVDDQIGSQTNPFVRFTHTLAAPSVGVTLGRLEFSGSDNSTSNSDGIRAYVSAEYEGLLGGTALVFGVADNDASIAAEGMRLHQDSNLEVVGEVTAANFITTSDRRLKADITPIQEGLETIKKFVSYEYTKGGLKEAGFIAQEVQEVLPYAVREGEDGFLRMTDRAILAHMHKAILELELKIKEIESKL